MFKIKTLCHLIVLASTLSAVSCKKENMPPNPPVKIAISEVGKYKTGSIVSVEGYLRDGDCSHYVKKRSGTVVEDLGVSCTAFIQSDTARYGSESTIITGDRELTRMAPTQYAGPENPPRFNEKVRVTGIVKDSGYLTVKYVEDAASGRLLHTVVKPVDGK